MVDFSEFARDLKQAMQILSATREVIATMPSAPLGGAALPDIPTGLRPKAAIEFLINQTNQPKRAVERVFENCRGDIRKALEFFKWQEMQPMNSANEAWAMLSRFAGLELQHPFPTVRETLDRRGANPDDHRIVAALIGDINLSNAAR